MKHSTTVVLVVLLTIGLCSCSGDQAPEAQVADQSGADAGLGVTVDAPGPIAERIRELLRPWDYYDPAWESQATVIVLARGEMIRYPCEYHNGTLSMIAGDGFAVTEVIKGAAAWQDVVLAISVGDEPNFPPDYAEGRKYLLLLRPSEATMTDQDDPDAWRYFGPRLLLSETVAVIDLAKSEAEAAAGSVQATRSGKYDGFEFTPAKWRQLREADEIDLDAQEKHVVFLENVVLVEGASLADIRSYLGRPDTLYVYSDSFWGCYEFNTQRPKPDGSVSGRLEIKMDAKTQLTSYSVVFYEYWTEREERGGVAITSHRIRALDDEELAELGLRAIERTFQ